MTGPVLDPASSPSGASPAGGAGGPPGPPRAGAPVRPGRFRGRARSFRQDLAKRRDARRDRVANVVLAALLVVGALAIVTEKPGFLALSNRPGGSTGPGPPIVVTFGTPTVSAVSCAGGGTAYAERVPWTNSTQPLTTAEVFVRLYEIWDGDNIGDPGAVANATPSNVCAGSPPDPTALWYVVLAAPNGTNLLTYTEADSWVSVAHGSTTLEIEAGSTLVVVTYDSLAGTGRGLEVAGFAGTSAISGSVAL
jgi:hypothetical protein